MTSSRQDGLMEKVEQKEEKEEEEEEERQGELSTWFSGMCND